MNLITIPAGIPFLPALAELWRNHCAEGGHQLHDGLVLLPTRRAARGLASAFAAGRPGALPLDPAGGRAPIPSTIRGLMVEGLGARPPAGSRGSAPGLPAALLLPRIVALGALDEAPLALAGALTLPPAIAEPHRRAVLAKLILAMAGRSGAPTRSDAAWVLAGDLAALMDEAERAEIDLHHGLQAAADPAYAEHWEHTLTFLQIVTDAWPAYLAGEALMNPAAHQVALMDAQATAWTTHPPATPVLAVSAAADIPAVARLLRVIAALPRGVVILPGLDQDLPEPTWQELDEAHPQHGLRALIGDLGARRDDVRAIAAPGHPERQAVLRRALLPASALGEWQTQVAPAPDTLTRLTTADAQEEAVAIALLLRHALETPNARAALVTPDRALARRVAAELTRWGVVADDSAGEPLADTPPAVFLRLIAAALDQRLAPIPLLALLKHPLAAGGLPPPDFRRLARRLELTCLRGPAPAPGVAGLRRALDRARAADTPSEQDPLADLLARLENCLEPALRATAAASLPPADLVAALIAAAEALAATEDTPGPTRLWALEEGEALAALLAETLEALPALPPDTPACLPGLLDAALAGAVVRSRRATRGRDGVEHPRIFIWGLLEARLQHADLMILGGLTEGVWPQATDPGPWMSRPMRARAGLPSPELRVGQAAHDFWMAALAAPTIVLSAPRRRDGAPAVPSRWLTRLEALLARHGGLPQDPAASWAASLDLPAGGPTPAPPPRPCPPLAARPTTLYVTDIATLLRNPYEIYARRILDLDELDPLEQSADVRDYGATVHDGIHTVFKSLGAAWPNDAAFRLHAALHAALKNAGVCDALISWWSPRLARIAAWVDAEERRRRAASPVVTLLTEHKGAWILPARSGHFTLVGRADRIERHADGTIAILDYKTGTLPSEKDVFYGRAPQLSLEGAMAQAGAFGPDARGAVAELTYWRLSGDHKSGEVRRLCAKSPDGTAILIGDAADRLTDLIALYENPATTYPAQPVSPHDRPRLYAQLSRAAEWAAAHDESEGAEQADS